MSNVVSIETKTTANAHESREEDRLKFRGCRQAVGSIEGLVKEALEKLRDATAAFADVNVDGGWDEELAAEVDEALQIARCNTRSVIGLVRDVDAATRAMVGLVAALETENTTLKQVSELKTECARLQAGLATPSAPASETRVKAATKVRAKALR